MATPTHCPLGTCHVWLPACAHHPLHLTALRCAADFATGKARQLVPDEHYKQTNQTLAEAYTRCANVRGAGWAGWLGWLGMGLAGRVGG